MKQPKNKALYLRRLRHWRQRSQIDKQFGKGSVMRLGETEVVENIPAVSTGSEFGCSFRGWRSSKR